MLFLRLKEMGNNMYVVKEKAFMDIDHKINRKIIAIIKCIVFLCLIQILLVRYTRIMMNKQEIQYSTTLNLYEDNSIEVLFLGSSQMIYAAQPMILWEQYGITSYNMATSATTIPGNYWSARIAFETQSPKVVMLDCTFAYMETKTFDALPRIHAAIDGLWPSPASYEAINDLVEDPSKRFEFYWTPYVYHTRWKELTEEDFAEVSDHGTGGANLLGYMDNFEGIVSQYPKDLTQDVPPIVLEYIKKLSLLCRENDSELVLTILPVPLFVGYQPTYNALEKWAEEQGIPFVNGYDDPELWQLDYGTDFMDVAHMNVHGVRKSSAYIGEYLTEHYDLGMSEDEQTYAFWNERMQEYEQFRDSVWEYPLLSYGSAITFSADGNQDQFFGGLRGTAKAVDPGGQYTWTTGSRSDFYFTIDEPADALLRVNLQAVQPIVGKTTRVVDVYVNERYVTTIEVEAALNPTAFSVDITEDLWVNTGEQKLTFKYPDRVDAEFGAILLDYTLGLEEIYLERK